ncbi:Rhodanese-like domain-containing protein [Desarmillaria tabescens]|uniref:Rhodanese-like domain-containing protein n=1 Tax=Armillaria tabescens TaxID=1929756 RepID=A0AA39KH20_ARMTA|nr:Rhodanese-like domain-containing protein [Desarmillaria tabescens]KAK0459776.1 Rhodanese-like domain-containing protein [Desarmillaria tabescens]
MAESTPVEVPWYNAFPEPKSIPNGISAEKLHSLLLESSNVLVVDVRRTDFEGSFIKGAINLPAHSFYPTLPLVVFHCNSCKPGGRGPRTAGWYQDELDKQGVTGSRAVVLEGGIKGWVEKYGDDELTCKLEY